MNSFRLHVTHEFINLDVHEPCHDMNSLIRRYSLQVYTDFFQGTCLNFSYSRRARAMSHMHSFTLGMHDMNSLIRRYSLQFHTRILSEYSSHFDFSYSRRAHTMSHMHSFTLDVHKPCHAHLVTHEFIHEACHA